MVSDTILHVTLNIMNGVVVSYSIGSQAKQRKSNTKVHQMMAPHSFSLDWISMSLLDAGCHPLFGNKKLI